MSRVVVIGAGIGGMTTAARLATLGHSVSVFERSDHVGGKCRTEWIEGYAFDTGPTLLTLPAVYRDFFRKTGDALETVLEIEEVSPSFDYRFMDGSSVQFSNLSRFRTLKAIEESFGAESSRQWNELILRAERMWDASRATFIEAELHSVPTLMKNSQFLRDVRTIAPWKSLHSLTREIIADSRLQYIAQRYATYSGSDPRRAPAVLLSIAFVEEAFGAWHIKGGVGQLAQAIYNRAKERGVTFHCGTKVSEIIHDGNRALGIRLEDGSPVMADAVVANADASQVYTSLVPSDLRILKRARRAISRSAPSFGGFSLLLGMKKDPNLALSHHTILFPTDYETEFESIFSDAQPVERPAIYICSPRDPLMVTRDGTESWSVLINAPRHSIAREGWNWNDQKFSQGYAQKIIDQIESRGIEIRSHLELLEIRTPADLERETLSPGGSIYGTSSNGARAAFSRAKNRSPLHGLFCVGGSAHPGGGLPLVAISAEIVANAIDRG